jgi:hypothetical protein
MDANCPNCNQPISITRELAGQKVSCPHCGQHIQLPPPKLGRPTPDAASPEGPDASPEPKKTSGPTIAFLIVACLIAALVALGIIAAIAFPVLGKAAQRARTNQELINMRQVMMASRMYAIDHEGLFPSSLGQLIPDYLLDSDVFLTPHSAAADDDDSFIYIPGHRDDSPAETIILVSPIIKNGKRAVATADGAALVLDEAEYQQRSSGQP